MAITMGILRILITDYRKAIQKSKKYKTKSSIGVALF